MAAHTPPWLEEAFESAKKNFLKSLTNPTKYDFSKIHSIDDVYNATDEIQKQQAQTKTLRGLNKLKPFINGLNQYAGTIEVFVQAKADILSLIWVASSVITAFEKVVTVLADIGSALPVFKKYAEIFQQNEEVKGVLGLFYSDILEVYTILLNFLAHRKRNIFFESLWPNIRDKLAVVQENIHQHKMLMTSQVTLEHILQASQARGKAVDEYEKAQQARDNQHFSNLLAEFAPHMYDSKLADILQRSSVASGKWLRSNDAFKQWLDPLVSSKRCIWLHGIPGSGKTVLTANIIRNLMNSDTQVAFVFLTYENQELAGGIPVFHSLIFQLLSKDCLARPILFEAVKIHDRKLASDPDCARQVLIDILQNTLDPFIILDGLDEANEERRTWLLKSMLEILRDCPKLRLLLSSRREESMHDGADRQMCITASQAMESVLERSLGMFLYTKLVFDVLKDQGTAQDIQSELEHLPDGLDQAYGRVHTHFTRNLSKAARSVVKNILQWIACAFRPLRTEELLQILMIEPGAKDFTKGLRYARSIRLLCGPIIEEVNGIVHFVHFSAKGYFLGDQSQGFLRLSEAHLNAALVCSTYLSFTSLDPAFDTTKEKSDLDECLSSEILSGSFVLFEYAATEWVEHVKACNVGISSLDAQKLCEELSRVGFESFPEVRDWLVVEDLDWQKIQHGLFDDCDNSLKSYTTLARFIKLHAAAKALKDCMELTTFTAASHRVVDSAKGSKMQANATNTRPLTYEPINANILHAYIASLASDRKQNSAVIFNSPTEATAQSVSTKELN
ncbi:nacht domain protein [Colletotrichum camelliae]|nr:nacht domain protein [Colletotrichum camelliae]